MSLTYTRWIGVTVTLQAIVSAMGILVRFVKAVCMYAVPFKRSGTNLFISFNSGATGSSSMGSVFQCGNGALIKFYQQCFFRMPRCGNTVRSSGLIKYFFCTGAGCNCEHPVDTSAVLQNIRGWK